MGIYTKLLKTNPDLEADVDALIEKAVNKAVKEANKVAKTAVTDVIVEVKGLGLDRPSQKAVVEVLTELKSAVIA